MKNIFGGVPQEEYDKVVAERNRLKFRVEDLERSIKNLKIQLGEQSPRIEKLEKELAEKQMLLDKLHLEKINASEREIPKKYRSKRRTKTKSREGEKDV